MPESITVTNATILDFYSKNPHLDFEQMNLMFLHILKTLSTDLTKTVENSKIGELQAAFSLLKEDIQSIHRGYTTEVNAALKTSSLENMEKLTTLLERNTTSIVDKATNILNDIIPRSQIGHQKHMETIVKEFHNNISVDTKRLLELNNNGEGDVMKLMEGLDNKFINLTSQIHEPLLKSISGSEERMKNDIGMLKETTIIQAREQEKMGSELMDFLNKYKNSTTAKGSISENMLYEILQTIFPGDEIVDCRNITASGDFIVNRRDASLPSILVENKDYKLSVDTREVTKFERDVHEKRCHGIFLSQSSPITFKELFQVDIIDNLIHVYVPNTNFNQDKINIAVKIIDQLSPALNAVNNQDVDSMKILPDDLERIADEYRKFSVKRSEMIDFLKNTHVTMLNNLEDFSLPSIQSFLVSTGKVVPTDPLTCRYCRNFTGKTKSSLAAHQRKCKLNPKSPLYDSSPNNVEVMSDDKIDVEVNIT